MEKSRMLKRIEEKNSNKKEYVKIFLVVAVVTAVSAIWYGITGTQLLY
jgi:hypothetical protein